MRHHRNGAAVRQDDGDILDPESFEAFYRRETVKLRKYLKRRIWAEEDRNDLVQEAFVRLVASRSTAARKNPGEYLQGIVRNLLVDRVRAWSKSLALAQAAPEFMPAPVAPDISAEMNDLRHQYQFAIDALPPRTREVYLLHQLGEVAYREIAQQLGISVRTVEWHVAEAIVRISKCVAHHV